MTAALTTGVPAAPPVRRRQMLYMSAFAAAAATMCLATLMGMYLAARHGSDTWLKENQVPLTQPNVQLATLLMSMVTVQWAVYSISRNVRSHTYLALAITLLFGVAFINQTWFLNTQVGLAMTQLEGPYYYAVIGAHLAMVIGAMAFLGIATLRALAGSYSSRDPEGVSAAALFWHVTALLYLPVWLGVYIMK